MSSKRDSRLIEEIKHSWKVCKERQQNTKLLKLIVSKFYTHKYTVRCERNSSSQALIISWNTVVNEVKGLVGNRIPYTKTGIWEVLIKDIRLCSRNNKFCFDRKRLCITGCCATEYDKNFYVCALMGRKYVLAELNYRKCWRWSEKVLKLVNKEFLQIFRRELTMWRGITF